jgi:amidase
MNWQKTASDKRASLRAAIPSQWRLSASDVPAVVRLKDVVLFISRYLSPLELQITSECPIGILENIRGLNWSAVEVTRAFCHRAALAHQLAS